MTIRKTIAITLFSLALGFSTHAVASLGGVVEQAYEVAISDFRAPGTAGGTAAFKTCEGCDSRTVRVAADAQFIVNGKTVRFADFRKAVAAAGNSDEALVVVLHHLESDTIVSISVSY
jgi:hypothetical protein